MRNVADDLIGVPAKEHAVAHRAFLRPRVRNSPNAASELTGCVSPRRPTVIEIPAQPEIELSGLAAPASNPAGRMTARLFPYWPSARPQT
jgi:hypothetical protein